MIPVHVQVAQPHEADTVLALIEALLAELGDEGQEFALLDREKLRDALTREVGAGTDPALGSGRFLALLATDESGTAIGVLTLSTSFAIYAGGEYGTIDEMYVTPEWRSRGVGRRLVEAAVGIAESRGWFRLDVTGPAAPSAAGAPAGDAPEPPSSDRAVRFYRRLGFDDTGQKMRKIIAPIPPSRRPPTESEST